MVKNTMKKQQNTNGTDVNVSYIIGTVVDIPIETENYKVANLSLIGPKGLTDEIPVRMSKEVEIQKGKKYCIIGENHSENLEYGNIERYLWCNKITEVSDDISDSNHTILKGHLVKKRELKRTTNKKDVCSAIVCVKSTQTDENFYIPIVGWHIQAYRISSAKIGTGVIIEGWLQARSYTKEKKSKMSYEISVDKMIIEM